MKILACYKIVPLDDGITVKTDRTLSLESAEPVVGQYDFNAVEAAVQIKEVLGGSSVAVLTVGAKANDTKTRKAVLSRGADEMFGVLDLSLEAADGFATAMVLKAAVEKIGGVDLVICGEGSGDLYNQQTGNMLGELLGYATVNGVSSITPFSDHLLVERNLETEMEKLEVPLPAVISVTSDINLPRIATFKEIMAAGKKPFAVWGFADVGASLEQKVKPVSILAPEQTARKGIIFSGEDEETVSKFFDELRRII